MSNYPEPTILAKLDRSWGDRKEELRLEQDEYKGKPTFTLRVCWQGHDGKWRWAQQKPSESSGKCFRQFQLRPEELTELGRALMTAGSKAQTRARQPASEAADDDIPF